MNVAEFFDADERRRGDDEFFGDDWRSHEDRRATYQVRWIEATGEFYAMRQPQPGFALDQFSVPIVRPIRKDDLTVELLGVRSTHAAAAAAMEGWQNVMSHADSLEWARQRLGPPPPSSTSQWTAAFGEWHYRLAGCVYSSGCTFDPDGRVAVQPGRLVDLVLGPVAVGAIDSDGEGPLLRYPWSRVDRIEVRGSPPVHELRWIPHLHPPKWCYLAIVMADATECRFKVPGHTKDEVEPELDRAVLKARSTT